MEDLDHKPPFWWPFGRFECLPRNVEPKDAAGAVAVAAAADAAAAKDGGGESGRPGYTMEDFERSMRVGNNFEHMSNEQHSDLHFARQYPFLYARKFKYFFQVRVLFSVTARQRSWMFGEKCILLVAARDSCGFPDLDMAQ